MSSLKAISRNLQKFHTHILYHTMIWYAFLKSTSFLERIYFAWCMETSSRCNTRLCFLVELRSAYKWLKIWSLLWRMENACPWIDHSSNHLRQSFVIKYTVGDKYMGVWFGKDGPQVLFIKDYNCISPQVCLIPHCLQDCLYLIVVFPWA